MASLFYSYRAWLLALPLLGSCGSETRPPETTGAVQPPVPPISMCRVPPTADTAWYSANRPAPLLSGLNGVEFPITTTSPQAARYFRQGLMLAYGFNHAEAARSFYEATRRDSTCAMCYWGYAYVLGPNYNAGMEPDNFQRAYRAVQRAQRLAAKATAQERALIAALAKRYPARPVADRTAYDQAYATALQAVYRRYPTDPDIGTMYAEAQMDLHPWQLWRKDGRAEPWTAEIMRTLEDILRQTPRHPGANHLYIHATEASRNPGRATASAALLTTLVPGAGHLLHMPSHTYIRTGEYHLGSLANLRALAADSAYTTACHAQGVYPLAYFPHNYHFLAATATMEGNSRLALTAASRMAAGINRRLMQDGAWASLQHYYTIPFNVAVKFGRWDYILQLRGTDTTLTYPRAIRHYARGMAWLGKHDLPRARGELARLQALATDSTLRTNKIWGINSLADVVQIAQRVLAGEIQAAAGDWAGSVSTLRQAVALEDGLNYNEPPDWFFSVRHHLGAVLLQARRYPEAITVYQEDLARNPRNGWALSGLQAAYQGAGNTAQARQTQLAFREAWQWADTKLTASLVR